METPFRWEDIQRDFSRNVLVAMEYGAESVAGSIAAAMVCARHFFDELDLGRPRGIALTDYLERHQSLGRFFEERGREEAEIMQAQLDRDANRYSL